MKILVDRELIIKLAGLLKYSKNYYEDTMKQYLLSKIFSNLIPWKVTGLN